MTGRAGGVSQAGLPSNAFASAPIRSTVRKGYTRRFAGGFLVGGAAGGRFSTQRRPAAAHTMNRMVWPVDK